MFSFKKDNATYGARANALFNGFAVNTTGEKDSVYGVPMEDLVAWWNPEEGVTVSSGRVANWADMSGNYNLQNTSVSQFGPVPPLYISASASVYNNKPYIYFDGSAGQVRNLAQVGKMDENWICSRWPQGYTMVYAINWLTTQNQAMSYPTSQAGGFYYDNSVAFRVYAPNVPYSFKAGPSAPVNAITVYAHTWDTQSGQWWVSMNEAWRNQSFNDALVLRNTAAPFNIFTNLPGNFFRVGGNGNGTLYLFDVFIYNRPLTEAEYKKIYEYLKTKYRL